MINIMNTSFNVRTWQANIERLRNLIYNYEKFFGQFVSFKPLSYSFNETIRFDVKASFTRRPVSRLIKHLT